MYAKGSEECLAPKGHFMSIFLFMMQPLLKEDNKRTNLKFQLAEIRKKELVV